MDLYSGYVQVGDSKAEPEAETSCSDNMAWYPTGRNRGWQCPVCGRVYAPWVSQCQHCGGWGWWWYPYPWTYPNPYITWGDTDTAGTSGDYQVVYNGQTSGTQVLGNN